MNLSSQHPGPKMAYASESNARIYDFLSTHPIAVLATVGPSGKPHAVVIYYSVDKNFTLTFITKRETKKHENLQHNHHAMLLVYEPDSQTTAQITGIAKELTDPVAGQKAFQAMLRVAEKTSESGMPPISKLYAGQYIVYEVKPLQIRMAIFVRPDPGGYDIYETIDFKP